MQISTTILAIFGLFAVTGLVGVVAVTIISIAEDAEAQTKPRGCNRSVAANASQGRCIEPGKP
jgi:hypothetical protein